jgi:hypothetical protein
MFKPETVHTPGVSDVSVTVSPEVAVAPEAKLGEVGVFPPGLLNVMVWLWFETRSVIVYALVE